MQTSGLACGQHFGDKEVALPRLCELARVSWMLPTGQRQPVPAPPSLPAPSPQEQFGWSD